MKTITIITLYWGEECEYYVGAVEGVLSPEQKADMAASLNAVVDGEAPGEEDRTVGFRETLLMEQSGGKIVEDVPLANIWSQPGE